MDQGDLDRVNELFRERRQIMLAFANFNSDTGRILSITVADGEAAPIAVVPTSYMSYPPQMVESIKQSMTARLHQIDQELVSLGITGLEAAAR